MQESNRFGLITAAYQNSEVKIATSQELAAALSPEELYALVEELRPMFRQITNKLETLADAKGIKRVTSPIP